MKKIFCLVTALLLSTAVWASESKVTLEVPSMNCVTCPFTVKKALENVDGVSQAKVDFDSRLAEVVFDDTKTSVGALTDATKNAGYPSTVKK